MIFEKVLYGSVTVFNLITGIAILIISILVARTISLSLRRFLKEKVAREHLEIIVKFVYYTVIVLALLTALPMIGIRLSGLLVAGGVVGLAVGFASQNIVGNLILSRYLGVAGIDLSTTVVYLISALIIVGTLTWRRRRHHL